MSTANSDQPARVYRSLVEAVQALFPGIHNSTPIRWATKGVKRKDGTRTRPNAKKIGHRWVITDEDLDRFVEALTADRVDCDDSTIPTTAERAASVRKAEAQLDASGF